MPLERASWILFLAAVTVCAAASFTLAQVSGDTTPEPQPFKRRGSDFTRLLFQTNSPVLEGLITKDKMLIPRTETIGSWVEEACFSPDGYWLAYLQKRYVSGILDHTPYYETRLSVFRTTNRHSYTLFEKTSTFASNLQSSAVELFGWSSKGLHFVEIDLKDDRTEFEEFKAQRTLHSFSYSQLKTIAAGGRVKHQTELLKIGDFVGLHPSAPAVVFRRAVPAIPEIGVEAHRGLVMLIGSTPPEVQLPAQLQIVTNQPSDIHVRQISDRPVLLLYDSRTSRVTACLDIASRKWREVTEEDQRLVKEPEPKFSLEDADVVAGTSTVLDNYTYTSSLTLKAKDHAKDPDEDGDFPVYKPPRGVGGGAAVGWHAVSPNRRALAYISEGDLHYVDIETIDRATVENKARAERVALVVESAMEKHREANKLDAYLARYDADTLRPFVSEKNLEKFSNFQFGSPPAGVRVDGKALGWTPAGDDHIVVLVAREAGGTFTHYLSLTPPGR